MQTRLQWIYGLQRAGLYSLDFTLLLQSDIIPCVFQAVGFQIDAINLRHSIHILLLIIDFELYICTHTHRKQLKKI